MSTVALHTLGCKLNMAETSALASQFVNRGFRVVGPGEPADVHLINTCSVTQRANRECRQIVRRALRDNSDPFVIVTGCYAQLEPEEVASIEGVDIVLGSREKPHLFEFFTSTRKHVSPQVHVSDIAEANDFGPAFSHDPSDRTRAFLKVQDGCDYSCSFCTIPLARGKSRSQSIPETIAQASDLVARGFKEIVLTGVNVGDFGRKDGSSLLTLLRELVSLDGLHRIRISSIEPNLLTDDILEFTAASEKMCRHFHIPLQSGNDEILHRMRRRYVSSHYRDLIFRIHELMPSCGIGADVIVGFPGETEEHFETTCMLLEELPISYVHGFTYSERPNTPAAIFDGAVEPRVRFKRNERLRHLCYRKKSAFAKSVEGTLQEVLLEDDCDESHRYGFTTNYVRVGVPLAGSRSNTLVSVHITSSADGICYGSIMNSGMIS